MNETAGIVCITIIGIVSMITLAGYAVYIMYKIANKK